MAWYLPLAIKRRISCRDVLGIWIIVKNCRLDNSIKNYAALNLKTDP